ncbi:MAG TPA: IS5 family transposase [Rubrobacter sp.]|nr:IS5 family transposase [Rubrobacter sp.]
MPAVPPYIIEPVWEQFEALLPERKMDHPFGCHRPRIPDRVVFEKLVAVLVFGCAYWRIADEGCSATTLRRRRDEWIEMGLMDALEGIVLAAYDRIIGLELADVSVDGCITKAPCGGQKAGKSPVDRGKQGIKRSTMVDANGIPLGVLSAPANRHDSPLLSPTLEAFADLPEHSRVHLDKAYDSKVTRRVLEKRGLVGVISEKGKNTAPLTAGLRWVVERTNSWHNAHKKLVWCTEREGRVIDFWIAFSNVIIIVRRLIRQAWSRYRWEDRPVRCP